MAFTTTCKPSKLVLAYLPGLNNIEIVNIIVIFIWVENLKTYFPMGKIGKNLLKKKTTYALINNTVINRPL